LTVVRSESALSGTINARGRMCVWSSQTGKASHKDLKGSKKGVPRNTLFLMIEFQKSEICESSLEICILPRSSSIAYCAESKNCTASTRRALFDVFILLVYAHGSQIPTCVSMSIGRTDFLRESAAFDILDCFSPVSVGVQHLKQSVNILSLKHYYVVLRGILCIRG
jgi:hypothetical protein